MRTTINISDALLHDLRREAARSNRPFRTVLEEVLQRGLGRTPGGATREKVRIDPHPVGIKPGLRAMSMNQLYDQIEAEADREKP